MHKAIIVAPERAEEALNMATELKSLAEQQLLLTKELADKLDLTGEIESPTLKRLVRLQTDIRKLLTRSASLAVAESGSD